MNSVLKLFGHFASWLVWMLVCHKQDAVVLLYHAVDDSGWYFSVSPSMFERQMCWLARHKNVVPLADVVAHARGEKTLPKNSVAITIDDGYRDTLYTVLPLLVRYNVPATLFLTTNLDLKEPFNSLERLTWAEVETLAKNPLVSVEAHGHNHLNLTHYERDVERVYADFDTCNNLITKHTGTVPSYLAYPFGAKTVRVFELAREAGYKAAFTVHAGTVKVGDNLMGLRRVQIVGATSFLLFKLRTTGAVEVYRKVNNKWKR